MGSLNPADIPALLQALSQVASQLTLLLNPVEWFSSAYGQCRDLIVQTLSIFLVATGDPDNGFKPFVSGATLVRFEPYTQVLADAGLGAAVTYASFRLMWGHSAHSMYTVRILLPRLMLGIVLINFSMPLFQAAVDVNNALCSAVLTTIPALQLLNLLTNLDFAGTALTSLVVCALLVGVVVLALVYVVRYALLVVLAITAPLAALAFVVPDTHHYARAWGSLFVSTLFMQPLQLLILVVGLGLESETHTPLRHAFSLAALFIAFKVPGALHQSSSLAGRSLTQIKRKGPHVAMALAKAFG